MTANRKTLTAPRQQNRGPRTECSVWTRTLKIMAGKEILPRAGINFPALSTRGVTNIPARVYVARVYELGVHDAEISGP